MSRPVAVIVHLSGRYRGRIQRLDLDRLTVGTDVDADVRFSEEDLTPGLTQLPQSGPYATLERSDGGYVLRPTLDADVWVNGRRTEKRLLRSGDVLEIGEGGPVLRYRLYPPGSRAYKSVSEVFSDCAECAKHSRSTADRAALILAGPPMELLTRTAPWVRAAVSLLMAILVISVGALWVRSQRLEGQLHEETLVVQGLAELLEREDLSSLTVEEVAALRRAVLESTQRIAALEQRSEARGRVIAESARSVAFIQGAWGLEDEDGRPLRLVLGPEGNPIRGPAGPEMTLGGQGPPLEILYTGTAFVVSAEGHLLTNRHVAMPWEYDFPAQLLETFRPVMRRFVGYLPGVAEPFEVRMIRASDTLDMALLKCEQPATTVRPIELAPNSARPGDEVIVMGYPTGIQALIARADPSAVEALMESGPMDFWQVARELSQGGWIQPLATVGVVGQVTSSSVVYDAETTHGGSGGPVLSLDGKVLAVNTSILPEFDGSNMGVPASEGLRLLHAEETAD